ncbi:MAG: ankyrin repeat domain-containing protein, partial [Acidimicrobiales bacterium]|nr:ankyrin repeat domain-containing protein [Acidimicrobiales bacterium]
MTASGVIPPLGPDDVYLYAHGNGAICLLRAGGKVGLVPLDEATSVASAHQAAGGRIHLAHETGPLASQLLERLAANDVDAVRFAAERPPDTWPHGTDALMEAAAIGADRLLDDLVARGADLHRTDDSGSTALHHAAMRGNTHAVAVLVEGGADIEARNDGGMTPRLLALEGGQHETAKQL